MSLQIRKELDNLLSNECINGELQYHKYKIILFSILLIGLFVFIGTYIWTLDVPQLLKNIATGLFVVIILILFMLVYRSYSGLEI